MPWFFGCRSRHRANKDEETHDMITISPEPPPDNPEPTPDNPEPTPGPDDPETEPPWDCPVCGHKATCQKDWGIQGVTPKRNVFIKWVSKAFGASTGGAKFICKLAPFEVASLPPRIGGLRPPRTPVKSRSAPPSGGRLVRAPSANGSGVLSRGGAKPPLFVKNSPFPPVGAFFSPRGTNKRRRHWCNYCGSRVYYTFDTRAKAWKVGPQRQQVPELARRQFGKYTN